MVDNIAVTPGTGATIAADDIGGVLHQRVKVEFGADGAASDVSSATPFPVTLISGGTPTGTAGTPNTAIVTVQGATSGTAVNVKLTSVSLGTYETVAASQTAQVLGSTGATGDYISGLLVIPATTSPGSVALLDNTTSITVFTGGASSVGSLVPFFIPLGIKSVSGAWKVTTGASVSVIGVGNFT